MHALGGFRVPRGDRHEDSAAAGYRENPVRGYNRIAGNIASDVGSRAFLRSREKPRLKRSIRPKEKKKKPPHHTREDVF